MKKHLFSFVLFSLGFSSFAQDEKNFQQLKPTANPAYMLLGIAPTNIERPSTPKEFAASIQNATVDGKVTPNFALEINPYELFTKSKVSYAKKALNMLIEEKNNPINFFKNISLSMATSATDTITLGRLAKGSSAALGFKTTLYNGKPSKETKAALLDMTICFFEETFYNAINNRLEDGAVYTQDVLGSKIDGAFEYTIKQINNDTTLKNVEKEIQIAKLTGIQTTLKQNFNSSNNAPTTDAIKKYIITQLEIVKKQEGIELKKINKKLAFAREGLIWDMSAAYMGHFSNNDWDSLHNAKWATWTTVSYRINADKTLENVALIDFIGLVRYTGNNIKVDSSNYIDVGAKLQFTYNRISFSGEYIYRQLTKKPQSITYDFTDRVAGNLEYVVSNLITLKASVGRTFDGNSAVYDTPNNKIFAIGGINLSILNGQ